MNGDNGLQDRLRLEHWPIGKLVPSARNARTHSPAQVAEIAGSIRAFGFSNPLLVSPGGDLIAGHGRLAAARILNLDEVPVIVVADLTETQQRQLMLADNRIGLNAGWNVEMLNLELKDLSVLGADLAALGFTTAELAAALGPPSDGLTEEDEAPPLLETAITRLGDIWCLGPHRLACGDSTADEMVGLLLAGTVPALMVTDPPYGVEYDPEWRNQRGLSKTSRKGKVSNDHQADWSGAWRLFPGNIAYVWHAALQSTTVAESLLQTGFTIRCQIIWCKERLVIGRGDYHWMHEPCWYAVRGKGHWTGDRKQTSLWTIPSGGQDADTVHSTQKPVECMRRPMLNNSSVGQAVYDPFIGSGTTLVAAETSGRVCYGLELEPRYVDVALRRWESFTGKFATLLDGGGTFADVAAARDSQDSQ